MKLSSKVIAKILTLCGISLTCTACYGVPHAMYTVKIDGLVIDERTDEVIENISVRGEASYVTYKDTTSLHTATVQSDSYGRYRLNELVRDPLTITIIAEDIDGAENGGEFETKTIKLELDHSDFHEISAYDFEYSKTVDVYMTEKENDEE